MIVAISKKKVGNHFFYAARNPYIGSRLKNMNFKEKISKSKIFVFKCLTQDSNIFDTEFSNQI